MGRYDLSIHDPRANRKKELAKKVSDEMVSIGGRLNQLLWTIKEEAEEEEFRRYRRAIGEVMGVMLLEVMNPLYAEHPDVKPAELD